MKRLNQSIGRVLAALEKTGGECLITADHGNAEQMVNPQSGQAHTAHTCEPVPLIYVGRNAVPAKTGALQDIAPTILPFNGHGAARRNDWPAIDEGRRLNLIK